MRATGYREEGARSFDESHNTVGPRCPVAREAIRSLQVPFGRTAEYVGTQSSPRCTFCAGNTIVLPPEDQLFDHVMFQTSDGASLQTDGVDRILDAKRAVPLNGLQVRTHLSDHFGVRVALTP